MSESLWETEAALQTERNQQPQNAPAEEPAALAVSADDFAALEERIRRAVELVKQERQAHAAAEARAAQLEAIAAQAESHAKAQSHTVEQLEGELRALRGERDQVRQRVERLLKQLDSLEL